MTISTNQVEDRAKAHMDGGELQAAYDLLTARESLSPREAYYLAFCFMQLNPERHQEATELFDAAEALGFTDFWLYYHRSLLLAASKNHVRVLQDSLKVLMSDPLPERIDLAFQSISAIAGAGPAAPAVDFGQTNSILLAAVWAHVMQLRSRVALVNRKIVKVDKGDFEAFVYQSDLSGIPTPGQKMLPRSPVSARQFVAEWNKSQDILLLLIAWYAADQIPTAFLDIGSNIGSDAIRVAKFSRLIDEQFPIISFEPGIMATLVPHSLRLNGVENIVTFEEKCVSDNNKPVVLFGEADVSVNNRIVNRIDTTEGFSKIVNAISVSDYLLDAKFSGRHPILKIDTQGAEWLIWNGMKKEISRRSFSMVMELTPWALTPMVPTKRFLEDILESFFIVDVGSSRERFAPITHDNLDQRIVDVQRSAPHWTDLLCVSRSLPSAERLIDRIAAGFGASAPDAG